ncbi:MAG: hypothetical protein A3J51_06745 [Omnitrophica WOR_2 bacterium RIFCSPHIGHO2_02_FULL_45_21]|nr:MAG: hypothetical protein A3J51_06745 [Omnitrophica WOR_2 bacterium RIFCSPHIGHO2_02_FULL_45_21]
MRIITVSGAHSGVGKTKVAEMLLKKLRGWSAIKVTVSHRGNVCPRHRDCGACDELGSDFAIVSDREIIEQKGKDTQRFKQAGAKDVLWLKARPRGLKQGLKKTLFMLKKARGIIIEGNSILKYLKPDLAIFVKRGNSVFKPSAKDIFNKVDSVVTTG